MIKNNEPLLLTKNNNPSPTERGFLFPKLFIEYEIHYHRTAIKFFERTMV